MGSVKTTIVAFKLDLARGCSVFPYLKKCG